MKLKAKIFTVCVNDYEPEICALTIPNQRAYAKLIGAEHEIIHTRKFPKLPVTYEKLQVYELMEEQDLDVAILVDADLAFSPGCPDILNVPDVLDTLGVSMEYDHQLLFQDTEKIPKFPAKAIVTNFLRVPRKFRNVLYPLAHHNPKIVQGWVEHEVKARPFIIDEYQVTRNLATTVEHVQISSLPSAGPFTLWHGNISTEPQDSGKKLSSLEMFLTYNNSIHNVTHKGWIPHLLNFRGLLGKGIVLGDEDPAVLDSLVDSWLGEKLFLGHEPFPLRDGPHFKEISAAVDLMGRLRKRSGNRVSWIQDEPLESLSHLPLRFFDFIYDNASSAETDILKRVQRLTNRVKKGGLLMGQVPRSPESYEKLCAYFGTQALWRIDNSSGVGFSNDHWYLEVR